MIGKGHSQQPLKHPHTLLLSELALGDLLLDGVQVLCDQACAPWSVLLLQITQRIRYRFLLLEGQGK